jgi:hypothetical protein
MEGLQVSDFDAEEVSRAEQPLAQRVRRQSPRAGTMRGYCRAAPGRRCADLLDTRDAVIQDVGGGASLRAEGAGPSVPARLCFEPERNALVQLAPRVPRMTALECPQAVDQPSRRRLRRRANLRLLVELWQRAHLRVLLLQVLEELLRRLRLLCLLCLVLEELLRLLRLLCLLCLQVLEELLDRRLLLQQQLRPGMVTLEAHHASRREHNLIAGREYFYSYAKTR